MVGKGSSLLVIVVFSCVLFACSEAEQPTQRPSRAERVRSSPSAYVIEVAHDDESFIINGEKFEAQTYCWGWEEGDEVLFVEGSPFGACATAELFNLRTRERCDVWCE